MNNELLTANDYMAALIRLLSRITAAQYKHLVNLLYRIQRCENEITRDHWCDTCQARLKTTARLLGLYIVKNKLTEPKEEVNENETNF